MQSNVYRQQSPIGVHHVLGQLGSGGDVFVARLGVISDGTRCGESTLLCISKTRPNGVVGSSSRF